MKNVKRVMALIFVLSLSINTFGAQVSDNDGSAFITKAEFDSLKNSFQAQLDQYNQSIDSKIDGAIASYLSGIQIVTETVVKTGFDYEGHNGEVRFVDNGCNYANMSNAVKATDKLEWGWLRTYAPINVDLRDTYNINMGDCVNTEGESSNFLISYDDDGLVENFIKNATISLNRTQYAYTSNNARYGGIYTQLNFDIKFPSATDGDNADGVSGSETKALVDVDTKYYGWTPNHREVHTNYPNERTEAWIPYNSTYPADTVYESNELSTTHTDSGSLINTWSMDFEGDNENIPVHFSFGSTNTLRTAKHWGKYDSIKKRNTEKIAYEYNIRVCNVCGQCAYLQSLLKDQDVSRRKAQGYGIALNDTAKPMSQLFYQKISKNLDRNESIANGFYFYSGNGNGKLTFKLKNIGTDDSNAYFSKQKFGTSIPTSTTPGLYEIRYKDADVSSSNFITTKFPVLVSGKTYIFELDYSNGDTVYFGSNCTGSVYTDIKQTEEAKFIGM